MYLFPITVIYKIAEESRSGMADAPTAPWEPRRRRRWSRSAAAVPRLSSKALRSTCEADPCDRSAKVAGVAGAC